MFGSKPDLKANVQNLEYQLSVKLGSKNKIYLFSTFFDDFAS